MYSTIQLVFIIDLLYNVQCSPPIDDRTLQAYRHLKEKFQETEEAMDRFEKLFYTDISSRGIMPNSILNRLIGDVAVPKELEEEYGILGSLRIWEKMDSWTRPEESSDRSSQLPSLALELSDRVQPDSLDLVVINRLVYKFYKDTKRKVYICSVKLYTDANHPTFKLLARFSGAGVNLFPTMCGKGVCFIMNQIIGGYHLIVVNQVPISKPSVENQGISILVSFSSSDSINLDIKDMEFGATNEVQKKTISNFKVIYNRGGRIVVDSSSREESLKITSQIDCEDVVFGKDASIQPFNYFDPGNQGHEVVIHSSKVTVKNNVLTNQLDFNLTDSRLQDGVLSSSVPVELAPKTFLVVNKRYYVYPSGIKMPTLFSRKAIISLGHTNSFEVHSHAALYFTIYGLSSPEVTIYKIVNGIGKVNFPGFEYLISRHMDYTVLVVQTYETKPQDTGVYLIEARSGSKSVFKNFTVGIYEEKTRIEMFDHNPKSIANNGTIMKVVQLTCKATGKPRPTITFYESLVNVGFSSFPDYSKSVPIVNNDVFEIMAPNITDDLVSRSIIVHKFPNTTNYEYAIICEASNKIDRFSMEGYVSLYDFE